MDGEKSAANACQNDQTAANKERTRPFSGAVAHRAVYGSNRCGYGGRKVGGKEGKLAPSRLSKMSSSSSTPADNSQQAHFSVN